MIIKENPPCSDSGVKNIKILRILKGFTTESVDFMFTKRYNKMICLLLLICYPEHGKIGKMGKNERRARGRCGDSIFIRRKGCGRFC